MLHRELKINFGELERVADALDCYKKHLEKMEQCVRRIWSRMDGMKGQAGEALLFSRNMLQGSLQTEMQAVQETNQLLRKYIAEMTGIIQPELYGREMVVDRNDIFANIITMAEQSERLLNLNPYTIIWSGDVCTRFPDAQTRKKEELYYKKVNDLLDRTVPAYGRQIVADIGRIMLLYDDKINGYENMDDEYASLARELYLKYTGEERRMYRYNELWCRAEEHVLIGMWDALTDIVIEPVLLLTEAGDTGIACMYYCLYDQLGWEKPDWMTERVEGFARGTQAIADDPFLLVEGMAQEISDTYEEKGIFYCGGYIGGSILITKGIDKAVRSARLMGGAGEVSGRARKLFRGAGRLDDVDDLIPRLRQLEDILPADDIAAYKKYLQNRSPVGLTQEELQAIQRVDDYLAMDQADFDELLRMGLGESGSKTVISTLGNEIDITPSSNHSSVNKNPGPYGEPNTSVDILDADGNVKTRRWYDSDGKAYRDVDMCDHGNPKEHPEVPHEHTWEYNNGKPKRN